MNDNTLVELWRPVVGNETEYQVSSRGRVWSNPRTVPRGNGRPMTVQGRYLKPFRHTQGYLRVQLPGCRVRRVHVLMLEAFVCPCPPGMLARHLNDVPDDNRLENLQWGTYSDNLHDAVRNGRHRWS